MTAPIVLPSKPREHGASQTGSQRDRRFTDTLWDTYKHPVKFPNGRPFTGEREFTSGTDRESITAGFITSDLSQGAYYCDNPQMGQTDEERRQTLLSVWECPWVPLPKYFRFNYRTKRITYALDKMIADENEGLSKFWEAASTIAGDGEKCDEETNEVSSRIKRLLGHPRKWLGKIKLAQAMKAGEPWLLGFTDTPNEELAKILGKKVNYIGGHAPDSAYTVTTLAPEPKPVVTPEQVLATPPSELAKMIAEAVALAVPAALAAQKQADRERMERVRAKRKPRGEAA